MLALVYKDIICQKKRLWLILLYSAFMHLAFFSLPDLGAYVAATIGVVYIFVLGACALEEKNRSDVLTNSLPISRGTIVKARYLTGIFFQLAGIGASILTGTIIHYFGFSRSLVNLEMLVAMVVAPMLLWSLYYPVYFKFGYVKSRYYHVAVFMLAVFGPSLLLEAAAGRIGQDLLPGYLIWFFRIANLHDLVFLASLLFMGFLLCLISLALSIRFYRGREFS